MGCVGLTKRQDRCPLISFIYYIQASLALVNESLITETPQPPLSLTQNITQLDFRLECASNVKKNVGAYTSEIHGEGEGEKGGESSYNVLGRNFPMVDDTPPDPACCSRI